MKLLLDTHALLWWWQDHVRLSPAARAAIADPDNTVLVSAASAWEISIKYQSGKLPGAASVVTRYDALVQQAGFAHLPIEPAHALRAGSYAQPHRDPFDRMLVAQSEIEGATLVSCDVVLGEFGVPLLW